MCLCVCVCECERERKREMVIFVFFCACADVIHYLVTVGAIHICGVCLINEFFVMAVNKRKIKSSQ